MGSYRTGSLSLLVTVDPPYHYFSCRPDERESCLENTPSASSHQLWRLKGSSVPSPRLVSQGWFHLCTTYYSYARYPESTGVKILSHFMRRWILQDGSTDQHEGEESYSCFEACAQAEMRSCVRVFWFVFVFVMLNNNPHMHHQQTD